MFKKLTRKRLSEGKLATMYVNAIIDMVDTTFPEVAGLINEDPQFETPPHIDAANSNHFLYIVIAGNLSYIPEKFPSPQDKRISNLIIEKFAKVLGIKPDDFLRVINEYTEFIDQVGQPSLNRLHGIVKAVFFKYDLNDFQEEHFRKQNSPSPVFIHKMTDVFSHFIWSWDSFFSTYRLSS